MVEIFLAVEKIFSCAQEEEKGKERREKGEIERDEDRALWWREKRGKRTRHRREGCVERK